MQSEMIRIVKQKTGEFVIGKADGRSAYVCDMCQQEVIKKRLLNRAFRMKVPQDIYEKLKLMD